MRKITVLIISILCSTVSFAKVIDLSKNDWKIWLDKKAAWEHDTLFLPPVNLSELPVNPPTCGWDKLRIQKRVTTNIPATVEQFFWGENGNPFGVSGNYVGVSWFSTEFNIDKAEMNKRIVLHFEGVRLRAEVYVNKQLAGYDIINGTPFTVNVGKFIKEGKNMLDVRITDPNGNFAWRDWETYKWGNYDICPSHGFGGITGKVQFEVCGKSYINDVYVKNLPDLNSVEVEVTLGNSDNYKVDGTVICKVLDETGKELKTVKTEVKNSNVVFHKISVKGVNPWSPDQPNLYTLQVEWNGNDGSSYETNKKFGFRWFDVREVNGDKQFFLNGKRIVLRSAISWGHWPVNGIYPTDELAKKQIKTAKQLGLNMLNSHRGIGQTNVLNYADELGLLYYEEPGGYKPGRSEFALKFKQIKLLRMVKRDRSHPSLVLVSMINEANRDPFPSEFEDMRLAHQMDETLLITFTSTYFGKNTYGGKAPLGVAPIKLHMLPADTTQYTYGWWDEHHAGGPGVYLDNFYNGPDAIYRNYNNPKEIIVLGEEGAIGTPPRLELLKKQYEEVGNLGWDGDTYLAMFNAYNKFLDEKGFRKAFPTVDDLTTSMGKISHYYQGRIIENVRIGNLLDGYVVNGWENTKVENHSGIVDIFRNPKTDPKLLAYYNQPLYMAVKIRNKVIATGDTTTVDFFIVNEKNVTGNHVLKVIASDSHGEVFSKEFKVKVSGGNTYGELLVKGLQIHPDEAGYVTVSATLLKGSKEIATGHDEIYAVGLDTKMPEVVVADTSGIIQQILKKVPGVKYTNVKNPQNIENGKVLLVGPYIQPNMMPGKFRMTSPVMDWISRGNKLVIIGGAKAWAEYLSDKEILDYRGFCKVNGNWFGGCYFVKDHPLFQGLPTKTAFNWEYQYLAAQKRDRFGLRIANGETVVGVSADHKRELYDAVVVIPHGRGKIILSALDLMALTKDDSKSSVVAKKIIQNYIKY